MAPGYEGREWESHHEVDRTIRRYFRELSELVPRLPYNSITEIVAYEILGLAESGKGVELVKSGATALPQVRTEKFKGPFQIPVNAGGGLIADGHPVGATGVRQVFEAYQQLTDQAGARQIENAKKFLTFNMGGSLTTSVAMVWGRD